MLIRRLILSIILTSLLLTCSRSGNLFQGYIKSEDKIREYITYKPKGFSKNKDNSLVIFLHGRGSSGFKSSKLGFNKNADSHNFIIVYPQGLNGDWNYNAADGVDDLRFLSELIDTLGKEYNIGVKNRYIVGRSIGGFMAYKFATEFPGKINGVCSISGLLPVVKNYSHIPSVSAMHIHAIDDRVVRFDGYPNDSYSVLSSLGLWRVANETKSDGEIVFNSRGVVGKKWESKAGDKKVLSYIHSSGGHGWLPYTWEFVSSFILDLSNKNQISMDIKNTRGSYIVGEEVPLAVKGDNLEMFERVDFKINNKQIYRSEKYPFNMTWTPKKQGVYTIEVTALDRSGNRYKSPMVINTVVTKPYIKEIESVVAKNYDSELYNPLNIIDTKLSSMWLSSFRKDQQNIVLTLKKSTDVSGITLVWGEFYPKKYIVETSRDGTHWIEEFRSTKGLGGVEFIDFKRESTKYLRISCIERVNRLWGYSLQELFIH